MGHLLGRVPIHTTPQRPQHQRLLPVPRRRPQRQPHLGLGDAAVLVAGEDVLLARPALAALAVQDECVRPRAADGCHRQTADVGEQVGRELVQPVAIREALAEDEHVGAVDDVVPAEGVVARGEALVERTAVADGLLLGQLAVEPAAAGLLAVGEVDDQRVQALDWARVVIRAGVGVGVIVVPCFLGHAQGGVERVFINDADGRGLWK